jgi:hypothetical protein
VRLVFGFVVFIVYLVSSSYVIYKTGIKSFDLKVYITIFGFLFGMGLNVGLCYSLVILDLPLKRWNIVDLPQKVEDYVIITVFYRFIYEMRGVWLKITCDDF